MSPYLSDTARVTGYVADEAKLLASLPPGFTVAAIEPFDVTPPADCPYMARDAGDACLVAVVAYTRPASVRAGVTPLK